jgi:hypothetical protein
MQELDDKTLPLIMARLPEMRALVARELRLMAGAKGIYKNFSSASPWTIGIWSAAAEMIEDSNAPVLTRFQPGNDLDT